MMNNTIYDVRMKCDRCHYPKRSQRGDDGKYICYSCREEMVEIRELNENKNNRN